MKNINVLGFAFVGIFVSGGAFAQTAATVDPTFDSNKIYVGSGAPDLPSDLQTVLLDMVCRAKGFASSAKASTDIVELQTPIDVAIPILGYDNNSPPKLKVYRLDPKDNPRIAVVKTLSCWSQN